ncbi:MAG: PPOX class F420-dependent oxidoreductase [Phototrophicaceae bacterium]
MINTQQLDASAALKDEQYFSLTTFRKNGNPVATPVWFAEVEGHFYVKTQADSWKVKRIRNNSHVIFAACDARGNIHGETFKGMAQLHTADSPTGKRIDKALTQKYGLFKRGFDLVGLIRSADYTFIEINPQ